MIDPDHQNQVRWFVDADEHPVIAAAGAAACIEFVGEWLVQPRWAVGEWPGEELDDRGSDLGW